MNTALPPVFTKRRLLTALAAILLLTGADGLGLFDGLNARLYDAAFRIRGVRLPSASIVLVGIDEPSLQALGRWPLDRSFYARLLDRLSAARVVGFDLIFSEPSPGDAPLAEAIRKHGRVILAGYFDDDLKRVLPAPLLAGSAVGHVHIERDIDQVSRSLFHVLSDAAGPMWSLSAVAADIFRTGKPPDSDSIPSPPRRRTPGRLAQADFKKINFYGPPGTFYQLSLADVLSGRYPSSDFAGKIVLVGATAEGLLDRSSTPFGGSRAEMPGVEIQANALNNLLDGTAVRDAGDAVVWALNLVLALFGLAVFYKVGERRAALLWAAGLLAVSGAAYFLFVRFNVWLKPGLLYAMSALVFLAAYLMKLDAAARQLDRKYAHVAAQFGKMGGEGYDFGAGLAGLFSTGGINSRIQGLLRIEESYEQQLEEAVALRTRELAQALTVIKGMSRELILRLAKAIESRDAGTGNHVARVGLYAQILARAMVRPEEHIEAIVFTSSIHDIGKIGIPDRILLKQGQLTAEETAIMQSHPRIGYEILSSSEHAPIREAAAVALNHHEHWDGSGYPSGLKATTIPLEARIVAICDLYDALRSSRPYKSGLDHETAVRYITMGGPNVSPLHFDPVVLQAFRVSHQAFAEVFRRHL